MISQKHSAKQGLTSSQVVWVQICLFLWYFVYVGDMLVHNVMKELKTAKKIQGLFSLYVSSRSWLMSVGGGWGLF